MKAIILCAGVGSRFYGDIHKSLLFINGKTILEHKIIALRDVGIDEIYVVVGCKKEQFPTNLGVKYVYNDKFESSGNLYSFYLALKECGVEDYVIGLDGDLLFDYRILFDIKRNNQYFIDINKNRKINDIGVKVDLNNNIVRFGRDIDYGVMLGLAVYSPNFLKKIYNVLSSHDIKEEFIVAVNDCLLGENVEPVFVKHNWVEIDTVDDYEEAKKIFDCGEVVYGNDITSKELMSLYNGVTEAGWLHLGRRSLERNQIIIDKCKFFVARVNGRVIGCVRYFSDGAYNVSPEDWLVRPEYRGGGIGSKLYLEMVKSIESEFPIKVVTIPGDGREEAHKRLGYKPTRLPCYEIRYDYDRFSPDWKE